MLVRLPKTLNGQLTLKCLGELAKKYFPANQSGYRFTWPAIITELGDRPIDKSRWVLMTKDILPESRNKGYAEQRAIVDSLAQKAITGYEVPGTLEATACILTQYFDSNMRLFSDNPFTLTRCDDEIEGSQTVVGSFTLAGLLLGIHSLRSDTVGVAAIRKL